MGESNHRGGGRGGGGRGARLSLSVLNIENAYKIARPCGLYSRPMKKLTRKRSIKGNESAKILDKPFAIPAFQPPPLLRDLNT